MSKVEVDRNETFILTDPGKQNRNHSVREIKQLISLVGSEQLKQKIVSAQRILVIGPGYLFPEFDLFAKIKVSHTKHVYYELNRSIQKLIALDRIDLFLDFPSGIYSIISHIPECEIIQKQTLKKYCETHVLPDFDIILNLRMELLRNGERPDYLASYINQLLIPGGMAVVTGDSDGIERFVRSPLAKFELVTHVDNLPEGIFEGGFCGHSGVVISK
jgi:hypothetical protein